MFPFLLLSQPPQLRKARLSPAAGEASAGAWAARQQNGDVGSETPDLGADVDEISSMLTTQNAPSGIAPGSCSCNLKRAQISQSQVPQPGEFQMNPATLAPSIRPSRAAALLLFPPI